MPNDRPEKQPEQNPPPENTEATSERALADTDSTLETSQDTEERNGDTGTDLKDSVQNDPLESTTEADEARKDLERLFEQVRQAGDTGNRPIRNGRPGSVSHGTDGVLGKFTAYEENTPFGNVRVSESTERKGSRTEFQEPDRAPQLDGRTIESITYRPGQDAMVKFVGQEEPEARSGDLFEIDLANGNTVTARSDGSKVIGSTTHYHQHDPEGRLTTEQKDGHSETTFRDGSLRFDYEPPSDDGLRSATVSPDGSFTAEYVRDDGTFTISEGDGILTETERKNDGDFETITTDLQTGRQQLNGSEQGQSYTGDRWTGSDNQTITQRHYEDGAIVTSFEGKPHASGADEIIFKDGKLTFIKDGKEFQPENQSDIVHSVELRDGSRRVVKADGSLERPPAIKPGQSASFDTRVGDTTVEERTADAGDTQSERVQVGNHESLGKVFQQIDPETGAVTTSFENGPTIVTKPGEQPQFADDVSQADREEHKDLLSLETAAAENEQGARTFLDGRRETTIDPPGEDGAVRVIDYPPELTGGLSQRRFFDPEKSGGATYEETRLNDDGDRSVTTHFGEGAPGDGKLRETRHHKDDEIVKTVTEYGDRSEISFNPPLRAGEGDRFDPSEVGLAEGDQRLNGVDRIIDYRSESAQTERVRLEYAGQVNDESRPADLNAREIYPGVDDGVVESREFDGSQGRLSEQVIYKDGEVDRIEGTGKESVEKDGESVERSYDYRRWNDGDSERTRGPVEQRFYEDGSIRTDFEEPQPDVPLSQKYKSIVFTPPSGYRGLPREGEEGSWEEIKPEDASGAVLRETEQEDGSISRSYLNGFIETEYPEGSDIERSVEYPANDVQNRAKRNWLSDRTVTKYDDGREVSDFSNPADHGGMKRETTYPEDDPNGRTRRREYVQDTPGGLESETFYRGDDDTTTIVRDYDGTAGRSSEREVVDSEGKRISLERNGRDDNGSYNESVDERAGITRRRYDNGRFEHTDADGNVIASGFSQPFENGEGKGTMDIDEKTGKIVGVTYTEGPRAGHQFSLVRNPDGTLKEIKARIPGKDGQPASEVTLTRGDNGWQPADAEIPGFDLRVKDGAIQGDFSFAKNGTVVYDNGDNVKQYWRADGTKETRDFNNYSRVRETADGTKLPTEYWTGYKKYGNDGWKEAERIGEDGTVYFKDDGSGGPVSMKRNGDSDTFTVNFANGLRYEANWAQQRMKRVQGDQSTNLWNTGQVDADGKPLWREAAKDGDNELVEEGEDGSYTVTFQPTTPAEQALMLKGQIPQRVTFSPADNRVYSRFADGKIVGSNGRGDVEVIRYQDGRQININRDSNNRVRSITGPDGKIYTRRSDTATHDGTEYDRWSVIENDRVVGTIDANFEANSDGSFDMIGPNFSEFTESNGRTTTKVDGKIVKVVDMHGQQWKPDEPVEEGGSAVWRVSGDNGSRLEGKLKMLPDGNVAVETADGLRTRNSDRSTSHLDANGNETQRDFDKKDGDEYAAQIIRRDGLIVQTRDVNGNVRNYEHTADASGRMQVSKVTLTTPDGKTRVVEQMHNGKLMELKEGASPDSTADSDYGATVSYDNRTGTRTSRDFSDENSNVHASDIHGSNYVVEKTGDKILSGEVRNPLDDSVLHYEGGKLRRWTNGNIETTFKYKSDSDEYSEAYAQVNDDIPVEILRTNTENGETVSLGRLQTQRPEGAPEVINNVLSELRRNAQDRQRTGSTGAELLYFNPETKQNLLFNTGNNSISLQRTTDGNVDGWTIEAPGGRTLITGPLRSDVSAVMQDGNLQMQLLDNGTVRNFIYEGDKRIRVDEVRPGSPPETVTTDVGGSIKIGTDGVEATTWLPVQSGEDGEGSDRQFSHYNPLTNSRTVFNLDENGTPTGSVETLESGEKIYRDGDGNELRREVSEPASETGSERVATDAPAADLEAFVAAAISGQPEPQGKVLPDGRGQLTYTYNDGSRRVETYDPATQSLTIQMLDSDGTMDGPGVVVDTRGETTFDAARFMEMVRTERPPGDARAEETSEPGVESRVYPDRVERVFSNPDGTSRIDTFVPGQGIKSQNYNKDGEPVGEPVDLNASKQDIEQFIATARANQSVEGRIHPNGQMDEVSSFSNGDTVVRSFDPATGKLTQTVFGEDGEPKGEPSTRTLNADEQAEFASRVAESQPEMEGKVYPDGRVEQVRTFSDGSSRVNTYNPTTGKITQQMLDKEGEPSGTVITMDAEHQSGDATDAQLAEVDKIVESIKKSNGSITSETMEQLSELLRGAEQAGNRQTVISEMETRLAESSRFRIHIGKENHYKNVFSATSSVDADNNGFNATVTTTAAAPPAGSGPDDTPPDGEDRTDAAERHMRYEGIDYGGLLDSADREAQEEALSNLESIESRFEGSNQTEETATLNAQRAALRRHAANMPPELGKRLTDAMDDMERRLRRGQLDIDARELARTYYWANRMLEHKGELPGDLSRADLARTAISLVNDTAHSYDTNQGEHGTCGASSPREVMLSERPSLAGKIAFQSLTQGEFTAPDGRTVKLDPASMKADREAVYTTAQRQVGDRFGTRDQLGQVLDHALVNWAHQKRYQEETGRQAEQAIYTQVGYQGRRDNGERVSVPGEQVVINGPDLDMEQIRDINQTFNGRDNVLSNSDADMTVSEEDGFNTMDDFVATMDRNLEEGVTTLLVNADHPAVTADGRPGDTGNWHILSVRESRMQDGKKQYLVSDQRGSGQDKWVDAATLFAATRPSASNRGGQGLRIRGSGDNSDEIKPGRVGDGFFLNNSGDSSLVPPPGNQGLEPQDLFGNEPYSVVDEINFDDQIRMDPDVWKFDRFAPPVFAGWNFDNLEASEQARLRAGAKAQFLFEKYPIDRAPPNSYLDVLHDEGLDPLNGLGFDETTWPEQLLGQTYHEHLNMYYAQRFLYARDPADRQTALEQLRRESNNEFNGMASTVYQRLNFADAVISLREAQESGDTSQQMAALQRLAGMDGADRDEKRRVLDQYIGDGIEADFRRKQVELAELIADGDAEGIARFSGERLEEVMSDSPESSRESLELFRHAAESLKPEDSPGLEPAMKWAEVKQEISDLSNGLYDPRQVGESLNNLLEMADDGNDEAKRALTELGIESAEDIDRLVTSLTSDDTRIEARQAFNARVETVLDNLSKMEDYRTQSGRTPADFLREFPDQEMVDQAREQVRERLRENLRQGDEAFDQFINRGNEDLPKEERQESRRQSIEKLLELGAEVQGLTNENRYGHTIDTMQAIDSAMSIHEAETPQEMATHLRALREMQLEGNATAREYLSRLAVDGTENLTEVIEKLEAGDQAVFNIVKSSLPDGEAELNEFRVRQIFRDFEENTSHADWQNALDRLESEIEHGNDGAMEFLPWTRAETSMARLNEASTAGEAEAALNDLVRQSNEGSREAQMALAQVVLSGSDRASVLSWYRDGNGVFENKPMIEPQLDNLSPELRDALEMTAARELARVHEENPEQSVTRGEASALGYAIGQASLDGRTEMVDTLGKLLVSKLDEPDRTRSDIMTGLTEVLRNRTPGSDAVADVYIKGSKDPVFAQSFDLFNTRVRTTGDPASVKILAAATGGASSDYNHAREAQQTLEAFASTSPENQALVQDSLLNAYWRHGDKDRLLQTLGRINRDNDSVSDEVKRAMRDGIASDSISTHMSAVEGMGLIADQLTSEDAQLMSENLSYEVVRVLRTQGENLRPEVGRELMQQLRESVDPGSNPPTERERFAIQAMASLGKFATTEDVEMLSAFGGIDSEATGAQKEIKSLAAAAMLSILSKAENPEAKAAAFEQFTEREWEGLPPNDQRFKQAIIDYANGNPTDLDVNKYASMLVYNAGLRRPLAGMFKDVGIPGSDVALNAMAQRIAANTEGGEEAVRDIMERVDLFNALPPHLREQISGLPSRIDARQVVGQLANGRLDESQNSFLLRDLEQEVNDYQAELNSQVLAGQNLQEALHTERMDQVEALGEQTSEGISFTDRLAWLVGSNKIYEYSAEQARRVRDIRRTEAAMDIALGAPQRQSQIESLQEAYDEMARNPETREQALALREQFDNLMRQLENANNPFLTDNAEVGERTVVTEDDRGNETTTREKHLTNARDLARMLDVTRQHSANPEAFDRWFGEKVNQIEELIGQESEPGVRAQDNLQFLQLSLDVLEHSNLMSEGKTREADVLAINLWQAHGDTLQQFAPSVWNELTRDGARPIDRNAWERLSVNGLSSVDAPPQLNFGGETSLSDGLSLLANDLDPTKLDADVLRTQAFAAIDSDPAISELIQSAGDVSSQLPVLQEMFTSGMQGTKYETFVNDARDRAAQVQVAMANMARELPQLEEKLQQLQATYNDMTSPAYRERTGHHADAETVRQLRQRIESMENAINLFDPESDTNKSLTNMLATIGTHSVKAERDRLADELVGEIPGVSRERLENLTPESMEELKQGLIAEMADMTASEKQEAMEQITSLERIAELNATLDHFGEDALRGKFDPNTVGNWLKKNGVVIGVAIGATVAVIATMGTASPLAVAAVSATIGTAAYQGTQEALYALNLGLGPDEPGFIGAYARDMPIYDPETGKFRQRELFGDVVAPLAQQWAVSFATTLGVMGVGALGSRVINGVGNKIASTFFTRNSQTIQQLANRLKHVKELASRSGANARWSERFMREFADELADEGKEQLTGEFLERTLGRTNSFLGFMASALVASSKGVNFTSMRGNMVTFDSSTTDNELNTMLETFINDGHSYSINPDGSINLRTFDGADYTLRRASDENAGLPGTDVFATTDSNTDSNTTSLDASRFDLTAPVEQIQERDAIGDDWDPSEYSVQVRQKMQEWAQAMASGDYETALSIAESGDLEPRNFDQESGMSSVPIATTGVPVTINYADLSDVNSPEFRLVLSDLNSPGGQSSNATRGPVEVTLDERGNVVSRHNTYSVRMADPVISVPAGTTVEVNGETVELSEAREVRLFGPTADLDPVSQALLTQIKDSPAGQRMIAQQAMIAMEERLVHLSQHKNGNEIISPTLAQYLSDTSDMSSRPLDQGARALLGLYSSQDVVPEHISEMEVVGLLYDSGFSIQDIESMLGNQHYDMRKPIYDWLRAKEGMPAREAHPVEGRIADSARIEDDTRSDSQPDQDQTLDQTDTGTGTTRRSQEEIRQERIDKLDRNLGTGQGEIYADRVPGIRSRVRPMGNVTDIQAAQIAYAMDNSGLSLQDAYTAVKNISTVRTNINQHRRSSQEWASGRPEGIKPKQALEAAILMQQMGLDSSNVEHTRQVDTMLDQIAAVRESYDTGDLSPRAVLDMYSLNHNLGMSFEQSHEIVNRVGTIEGAASDLHLRIATIMTADVPGLEREISVDDALEVLQLESEHSTLLPTLHASLGANETADFSGDQLVDHLDQIAGLQASNASQVNNSDLESRWNSLSERLTGGDQVSRIFAHRTAARANIRQNSSSVRLTQGGEVVRGVESSVQTRTPQETFNDAVKDLNEALAGTDIDPYWLNELADSMSDGGEYAQQHMPEFTGYLRQLTSDLRAGNLTEEQFETAISLMDVSIDPSYNGRHLTDLRARFAGDSAELGVLSGLPGEALAGSARNEITFGNVPGWKIKTENGRPVIEDGNLVIQHDGTMTVRSSQLDSIEVPYDTVSTNENGTTTIKLDVGSQPIETRIPADRALLDLVNRNAGGIDTCSACISSYLLGASSPEGIGQLIASGELQTPLDLQNDVIGKVGIGGANVNHDALYGIVSRATGMELTSVEATDLNPEMISGWARGNLTPEMLASQGSAIYVATAPYSTSDATGSDSFQSHTYLITVDAQGNAKMIDPYYGTISDFDSRKIGSLNRVEGEAAQQAMRNLGLLDTASSTTDSSVEASRTTGTPEFLVQTEADRKINELSEVMNNPEASEADRATAETELRSVLRHEAENYARKLGLVVTDADGQEHFLIDVDQIELASGGASSAYNYDNTIRLNTDSRNPTSDLWHEMRHKRDVLDRTAYLEASRQASTRAFESRIQGEVFTDFVNGGPRRVALSEGQISAERKIFRDSPEKRAQLEQLLQDYRRDHPDSTTLDSQEIFNWLQNKENPFADHITQTELSQMMFFELIHHRRNGETLLEDRSELAHDPEARAHVADLMRAYANDPSNRDDFSKDSIESWLARQDLEWAGDHDLTREQIAEVMHKELTHYQQVLRLATLTPDAQLSASEQLWLSRRAQEIGNGARTRAGESGDVSDSLARDPKLLKLTRGIVSDRLGIEGDQTEYNMMSPLERRAYLAERARNLSLLIEQGDTVNSDDVEATRQAIRYERAGVELSRAISRYNTAETDEQSAQAVSDARAAALNLLENYEGLHIDDPSIRDSVLEDIGTNLVELGLVAPSELPLEIQELMGYTTPTTMPEVPADAHLVTGDGDTVVGISDSDGPDLVLDDPNAILAASGNVTVYARQGQNTRMHDQTTGHASGLTTRMTGYGDSTVNGYNGAQLEVTDRATANAYNDVSVAAYGNSTVNLHANSSGVIESGVTANLHDSSIVEARGESTVVANDTSNVQVPRSAFRGSPDITLNDRSSAFLDDQAQVTANGPDTDVVVASGVTGAEISLNDGASARFNEAAGTVTGNGTVTVNGNSSIVIQGSNTNVRIVVESGNPQIEIVGDAKVEVIVQGGARPELVRLDRPGIDIDHLPPIDRSRDNPDVPLPPDQAIATALAGIDPAFRQQLLDEPIRIHKSMGNAGEGGNQITSSGADHDIISAPTLRDVLNNPDQYPQLDYMNVVHELVGHRAFDNYLDQNVTGDDRTALELMRQNDRLATDLAIANRGDTALRQQYLTRPNEIGADYLSTEAGLMLLEQEMASQRAQGTEPSQETKDRYALLHQYKGRLRLQIEKNIRDNPETAFFYDHLEAFAEQTFPRTGVADPALTAPDSVSAAESRKDPGGDDISEESADNIDPSLRAAALVALTKAADGTTLEDPVDDVNFLQTMLELDEEFSELTADQRMKLAQDFYEANRGRTIEFEQETDANLEDDNDQNLDSDSDTIPRAEIEREPVPHDELVDAVDDVFDQMEGKLKLYEYSNAAITRLKAHAVELLESRLPGLRPSSMDLGSDQIAIILDDQTVLKIQTQDNWDPEWGARTWGEFRDAPMLPLGSDDTKRITLQEENSPDWIAYRQPYAEAAEPADVARFNEEVPGFWDGGPVLEASRQLGRLNGRVVLIDYDAVN